MRIIYIYSANLPNPCSTDEPSVKNLPIPTHTIWCAQEVDTNLVSRYLTVAARASLCNKSYGTFPGCSHSNSNSGSAYFNQNCKMKVGQSHIFGSLVWGHPALTLWCHLTKCHFQIACVECVEILGLVLNDKSFDLMSIKFVRVNNLFNGIWLHWLRFSVELELACRALLKSILEYELDRIKSS